MKKYVLLSLCLVSFLGAVNTIHAEESVPDTTAPVIVLVGDASISLTQGDTYSDQGATASDDSDGDITSQITVTGSVDTATAGTYTLTYTVHDSAGNEATPVVRTIVIAPPVQVVQHETVLIRNGAIVVYQGTVELPQAETVDVIDSTGTSHTIQARSVLGLLYALDQQSDAFSISNITYYSSFGALYLKCIKPQGGTDACDDWQYVINGVTPQTGMDTTVVSGGESIAVYFGSPHRVVFDATTITEGGSFTATAENYNYMDNTWSPLTNSTIGVTLPNPDDPYNPTVVKTQTVNAEGAATFQLDTAHTYTVGIVEDYYFPAYTITVAKAQVSHGGGGGGSTVPLTTSKISFSSDRAIAYLAESQSADGSFGAALYTDWAAIAVASVETGTDIKERIRSYLKTNSNVSSFLTDNERRAMALLALGENPYSFEGVDYITPILHSFDGVQFGDPEFVNDDVFALIPLTHAGYTATDTVIEKTIAFILSKQHSDGSWEESIDFTASVIQALVPFKDRSDVAAALAAAVTYLKKEQHDDGGFGSVYSTSWVVNAMNALGETWVKNTATSLDYFAAQQVADGAVLPTIETKDSRVWATSYVLPAALGKSWGALIHDVSKPVVVVVNPEAQTMHDGVQGSAPKKIVQKPLSKTVSVVAVTASDVPPKPQLLFPDNCCILSKLVWLQKIVKLKPKSSSRFLEQHIAEMRRLIKSWLTQND